MLKEIVKTKQKIIYRFKDLVLKLYNLKLLPPAKFDTREMKILYFVLCSVVVFYPNVDIQKVYQDVSEHLLYL